MAKRVHTTSEEGFVSTGEIGDYRLEIDGAGEGTPGTVDHLLATYAACYVPALRVGAEQRDVGDLGRIDIDVEGDVDESDKLQAIRFDITTEADLDPGDGAAVLERANALCKVHDALKESLHADMRLDGHAG